MLSHIFHFFRSGLALGMVVVMSGCSVVMAVKQPEYKNIQLVKEGTPREVLIAEYGLPTYTQKTEDGGRVDIFSFKQGYSKGNKAARAFFHAVADVFTLFIWEVIGTPAELIADGKEIKFKVIYDSQDHVVSYDFFEPAGKSSESAQKG